MQITTTLAFAIPYALMQYHIFTTTRLPSEEGARVVSVEMSQNTILLLTLFKTFPALYCAFKNKANRTVAAAFIFCSTGDILLQLDGLTMNSNKLPSLFIHGLLSFLFAVRNRHCAVSIEVTGAAACTVEIHKHHQDILDVNQATAVDILWTAVLEDQTQFYSHWRRAVWLSILDVAIKDNGPVGGQLSNEDAPFGIRSGSRYIAWDRQPAATCYFIRGDVSPSFKSFEVQTYILDVAIRRRWASDGEPAVIAERREVTVQSFVDIVAISFSPSDTSFAFLFLPLPLPFASFLLFYQSFCNTCVHFQAVLPTVKVPFSLSLSLFLSFGYPSPSFLYPCEFFETLPSSFYSTTQLF